MMLKCVTLHWNGRHFFFSSKILSFVTLRSNASRPHFAYHARHCLNAGARHLLNVPTPFTRVALENLSPIVSRPLPKQKLACLVFPFTFFLYKYVSRSNRNALNHSPLSIKRVHRAFYRAFHSIRKRPWHLARFKKQKPMFEQRNKVKIISGLLSACFPFRNLKRTLLCFDAKKEFTRPRKYGDTSTLPGRLVTALLSRHCTA